MDVPRHHTRSTSSSSSSYHEHPAPPPRRTMPTHQVPRCVPESLSFPKPRHPSFDSPRDIPMNPPVSYMSLSRPFSAPVDSTLSSTTTTTTANNPSTSSSSTSSSVSAPSASHPASINNRISSSSLPLPMQTPYYSLPAVADEELQHHPHQSSATSHHLHLHHLHHHLHHQQPQQQKLHDSPSSSSACSAVPSPSSYSSSSSSSSSAASYRSAMLRLTSLSSHHPQMLISSSSRDSTHTSSSYPPPDPPTILPAYSDLGGGASGDRQREKPSHAYQSFLSAAPPPEDSWIAVETIPEEYRLLVRLPGFQRDGITLATRRRRILHVVADSWNPGGGHFERRISFGYDADLTRVRAEFNGDLLRVIIPRRQPSYY